MRLLLPLLLLAALGWGVATPASATNYVVDTSDDIVAVDGKTSLREAVMASSTNLPIADAPAGEEEVVDNIEFDPDLASQPILLTEGQLEIIGPTGIYSPPEARQTLDAGSLSRHFYVGRETAGLSPSLFLNNLDLVGGLADRGGSMLIDKQGFVFSTNVVFESNTATIAGGAVYAEGAILIFQGAIRNNRAIGPTALGGGAVAAAPGAVINFSDALGGSYEATGNRTDGDGGAALSLGGGIGFSLGNFASNEALGSGGAVAARDGGRVSIEKSTVHLNRAGQSGGALASDSTAVLDVEDSLFEDNEAPIGGAIHWSPGATASDADPSTVARSLFVGNRAARGGALSIESAVVTITDSTLSGNEAVVRAGGIWIDGSLGGDPVVRLEHSTIAENTAGSAGGGVASDSIDPAALALLSTVVATNQAPSGSDLAGTLTSEGFNFFGSTQGATIVGGAGLDGVGNPRLGPLADNGGPTLSHLPAANSPLLDRGAATTRTEDQRGLPRTVGLPDAPDAADGTDIGAVEAETGVGAGAPPPVAIPSLGLMGLWFFGLLLAALAALVLRAPAE